MNVFISWSGERSKAVAGFLRDWLKDVIQALDPWISADIDKGERWSEAVRQALEKSATGIICVTSENLNAPWLLFEAGALSKSTTHVFTFLTGLRPEEVSHPLGQFQHTLPQKEDVRQLLSSMNRLIGGAGGKQLEEHVLEKAFEKNWPAFEEFMRKLPARQEKAPEKRSVDDMMAEVLENTRRMQRDIEQQRIAALANVANYAPISGITSIPGSVSPYPTGILGTISSASGLANFADNPVAQIPSPPRSTGPKGGR